MKDQYDKESTGKLIAKALEIIDGPVCMHVEFDRTCSGCIDFMKTNYPGLFSGMMKSRSVLGESNE